MDYLRNILKYQSIWSDMFLRGWCDTEICILLQVIIFILRIPQPFGNKKEYVAFFLCIVLMLWSTKQGQSCYPFIRLNAFLFSFSLSKAYKLSFLSLRWCRVQYSFSSRSVLCIFNNGRMNPFCTFKRAP